MRSARASGLSSSCRQQLEIKKSTLINSLFKLVVGKQRKLNLPQIPLHFKEDRKDNGGLGEEFYRNMDSDGLIQSTIRLTET